MSGSVSGAREPASDGDRVEKGTHTALLSVETVRKAFRTRDTGRVVAVDGASFTVGPGETVGLVGANGSGKTTIARLVAGLLTPDSGTISFEGRDLATVRRRDRRELRRRIHLIFQNPYTSLAPGMRVADLVAEPLTVHRVGDRAERRARALRVLADAQLTPAARYAERYPHELSGGERQRVALARALIARPRLIIADEPTQMLDAAIRAELMDLMSDMRARHGLAYLYITHDLALAQDFCERLVVLHNGRVVEHGPTEAMLARPSHPYTAALVDAVRVLQPAVLDGPGRRASPPLG